MAEQGRPYDVAVIGAGPAGLTAAIYTGRALRSTIVIEKGLPGGQLNETDVIENWPGIEETAPAPQLMKRLRAQAERFGAEILLDEVVRIEPNGGTHRVVTPRDSIDAKTIILACGSRPRELPAEGADRLKGKGLSYCATCDGFFFQGKHIVEVGAGDSGFTEALFLTRFVDSISIVVRHAENDPRAFRASGILGQRVREHPKIGFLWNRVVEELLGEDHVTGVRLKNLATGKTEDLPIDGVFVNIGHLPQTDFLRGIVELDDEGYIVTDARLRTNVAGMYAAGDARIDAHRYAQGVVATGEGAIAALEAEKYLSES
jgi:thioredoxin reductase (NADPH)